MSTFSIIWRNFKKSKRSIYSLYIFLFLFTISLFSEVISNDKPIVMSIDDKVYYPYIIDYKESDFGGVLETTPDYKGYYVTSLLKKKRTGQFSLLILILTIL